MKITCVSAATLSEKAEKFESYMESKLVDAVGLVYSTIYDKTEKPYTKDDFCHPDAILKLYDPESFPYAPCDYINYEDSMMATGTYLAAQVYRFKATRDPMAMERARRTFHAIEHVYEIGKQAEEGYFPKPYGGKYSEQASTDQYLYSMVGMMTYASIAHDDHKASIRRMVPNMVDYWVKRKYCRSYYHLSDHQWILNRFPSFLIMAYAVSGDKKFIDEFVRLNEEKKVYLNPGESQIYIRLENPDKYPFMEYEKQQGNKYFLLWSTAQAAMDILELDACLQHSDEYKSYWLTSMKKMWREGSLSLTEGGLARAKALYDPVTEKVSAPPTGYKKFPPASRWPEGDWMADIRTSRSLDLARVGVMVHHWRPELKANETVIKILAEIDPKNMRFYVDPDGDQLLHAFHYLSHQIVGLDYSSWLCAYWHGRVEGIISSSL